jgi:hypothetical protein
MPIQTRYFALFPILNEVCVTFRGPAWWIADELQFRSLSESEARVIAENAPRGFEHRIDSGQKALVFTQLEQGALDQVAGKHHEEIKAISLCSQVVLNLVAESDPVAIPYAVVLSEAFRTRLRNVYEFDIWGDTLSLRKNRYKIKRVINRREIQELYRITIAALKRKPEIDITLSRFCSALLKTNPHDKLIDLTISLESLIPGGGEFRFRFPYFLSLIVDVQKNERIEIFENLQLLYDARSALVHGSPERGKQISKAEEQWDLILSYAKQCILYLIQFESQSRDIDWKKHLTDLSYGESPLIWSK